MAIANYSGFQQRGTDLTKAEIRKKQLEIINAYKESLKNVRRDIEKLYARNLITKDPQDFFNISIQFNRLANLEKSIGIQLKSLGRQVRKITADASKLAIANNYYRQQYATNWLDPYSFTVLDDTRIDYAVFNRSEDFKKLTEEAKKFATIKQGRTLKLILKDNELKAINKINQTLNQGLIEGKSFRQMSTNMREAFNGNLNNSLRVVRTETHRTLNQGQLFQWQDAKAKGVKGTRQILSVLDTRTRPQSAQVDGQKENADGFFVYPGGVLVASPGNSGVAKWDVNDRETVINIIAGKSPLTRRGRDPITGKNEVFTFRSFDEWAKEKNLVRTASGRLIVKK